MFEGISLSESKYKFLFPLLKYSTTAAANDDDDDDKKLNSMLVS